MSSMTRTKFLKLVPAMSPRQSGDCEVIVRDEIAILSSVANRSATRFMEGHFKSMKELQRFGCWDWRRVLRSSSTWRNEFT